MDTIRSYFYYHSRGRSLKMPEEKTQEDIVKEMAGNKSAELLNMKKYSDHKDDYYLFIVLVKWRGEFVTWLANTKSEGFGWGHYFHPERDSKALEKATEDYHKRGFYQQPQTETMLSY